MFRHVVLIGFIPEATEQQRQSLVIELHGLPGAIPEIRRYVVGFDAGLAEGNANLAVVADFDDVEGYRVYATHPAHVRVITEYIRPIMASRTAVQHEYQVHHNA
jgi:hypothetical protein